MSDVLAGKAILIVDDEPDILESLEELLDMCVIDSAPDFDTARRLLKNKSYDGAILDLMGVNGLELMELTYKIGTPALILTANALTSKNFVKTLRGGAYAYIPKQEMINISDYLSEMIEASEMLASKEKGPKKRNKWFKKLSSFFDEAFGPDWKDKHKEDLKDLNLTNI
ncbi:MAG: response regulator [Desulfobacterales bacterium]